MKEPLPSIWKTNMLRLKRKGGGEINFPHSKLLAFIDNKNGGSEIMLDGGLTYLVDESPVSIRNALKRLEASASNDQ